ncbi:MAG: diadenylate cyclase CdaA [Lachnospiraceae bacterium]|nr:diadenylate cyclase CdaA [Lachnospiraceae bacterium]
MTEFIQSLKDYFTFISFPDFGVIDGIEILIIAFSIYHIVKWAKKTRAWALVRGIAVLFGAYFIAYIFDMNVIMWIFDKTIAIGITAVVIVFQPELRKALEQLGEKSMVSSLISFDDNLKKVQVLSDESVTALVRACEELSKHKTGALITIERTIDLNENIRSGINIDSVISSQLLINIFEHNTPLHDGAVIIRNDRIIAATCYFPLSDNYRISKELGTRHRAALGISEISDSLTIIVSEETGGVSVAIGGMLLRNVDSTILTKKLTEIQGSNQEDSKGIKWFRTNKKNEVEEKN